MCAISSAGLSWERSNCGDRGTYEILGCHYTSRFTGCLVENVSMIYVCKMCLYSINDPSEIQGYTVISACLILTSEL